VDAAQSLFRAVQSNNEQAIAAILGGPTELTSSRDAGQDKVDRELFVEKYQEMHRLFPGPYGFVTLYIGAENWPFPIPLVNKEGTWRFDADSGAKEVLFRRIGESELTAIGLCRDFISAAKHGAARADSATAGENPATRLTAMLPGELSGRPLLFNGYYFRRLPMASLHRERGLAWSNARRFALIAYPAEYRSSGVMTFVVTDGDVVYEKDLGPDTPVLATAMTAFHKDATWRAAVP
jgi:hypothetical protein